MADCCPYDNRGVNQGCTCQVCLDVLMSVLDRTDDMLEELHDLILQPREEDEG